MRQLKLVVLALFVAINSWGAGFSLFGSPYGPGGLEAVQYRAQIYSQMQTSTMVGPSLNDHMAVIQMINYGYPRYSHSQNPMSVWNGYGPKFVPFPPSSFAPAVVPYGSWGTTAF